MRLKRREGGIPSGAEAFINGWNMGAKMILGVAARKAALDGLLLLRDRVAEMHRGYAAGMAFVIQTLESGKDLAAVREEVKKGPAAFES